MSYIKVKNPLDTDVTTGFKGEYYTIHAKETKSLPQELAERFIEVYGFLELAADEPVKEVAKESEKKEEVKKVVKK